MKLPPKTAVIDTLDQARARIAELEKALDEAISIIVRRDAQLEAYERKIATLEDRLEGA